MKEQESESTSRVTRLRSTGLSLIAARLRLQQGQWLRVGRDIVFPSHGPSTSGPHCEALSDNEEACSSLFQKGLWRCPWDPREGP